MSLKDLSGQFEITQYNSESIEFNYKGVSYLSNPKDKKLFLKTQSLDQNDNWWNDYTRSEIPEAQDLIKLSIIYATINGRNYL